MATAPNPKSAPASTVAGNGAPIRVVTPDQDGNFHLKIAKGDVEKVQIVDVDMVLNLKDGSKLVLAGGALSATDENTTIDFSSGRDTASHLMEQVGKIELQKFDDSRVLNSEPVANGGGPVTTEGDANALGQLISQSQSGNAAIANVVNKALGNLENVVENNSSSINEFQTDYDDYSKPLNRQLDVTIIERPGKTPVEHEVGPSEPTLLISLLNTTGTTQVGNVLYGAGGSPASATDPRNATQFAAQVIYAPNSATEIHAVGNIPANSFVKVASVELAGSGATVQSVLVTGVPAGVQILNATDLGNGSYSMQGVAGQSTYNFELLYSTAVADGSSPIHPPQFSLTFTVEYSTNLGLGNLIQVTPFVIKDASSANDLTYIDATTGATVFVLPAQGVPHEIHAGNNAGTTIYGSNANDFLYGGTGNDTLKGGTGNTYFEGGAGADTIVGGNNGVQIGTSGVFGTNVNTIGYTGSATGVTVNLSTGTSTGGDGTGDVFSNIQNVMGSAYNDMIIVGDTSVKASFINGGGGTSDTLSFENSTAGVTVNLLTHNGLGGNAQNTTFSNIENVKGSAFDDKFIADSVANHFDGGSGGSDTVSYESSTSTLGVIVNLSSSTRSGVAASSGGGGAYAVGDTYTNIENVIGTKGDDVFVASSAANVFNGGSSGQDTVSYAASVNGVTVSFAGGRGSDAVVGQVSDAAGDRYINIQNVIGSTHNDIFFAGFDSVSFNGGGADVGGYDTVNYNFSDAAVTIDTIHNEGIGGWAQGNKYIGITKFVGSSYSDTFLGSGTVNQFDGGGGGSDTVDYHSSNNTALTIDLFNGVGSGGDAQGDTYAHIQNAVGSGGNDVFVANSDANSFDGKGGSNTVSYVHATDAVTVDLFQGTGAANYAEGDTYTNIQNVIGGVYDDTFIANGVANNFDGGNDNSTNTSHNRVSYINDTAGVTVNLFTPGAVGVGGLAAGDTYTRIQDVTGGGGNDTFIANAAANNFDGSGGAHNRVNYVNDTVGVTVDLVAGTGTGGLAAGDTYTNIQDVTGGAGNDTFIASNVANAFEGTNSGAGAHNRVSYVNDTTGVTVDLNNTTGAGTSGGYAAGDTFSNIQDLTGGSGNDTFVANNVANNFDGSGGTHNRVSYATDTAGVTVDLNSTTGAGTFGGNAAGDTFVNIQDLTGGSGNDTFIASNVANNFDGGGGAHNRVSYVNDTAGVTIDLSNTTGAGTSGGYAAGDTFVNIQDVTGGSGDDTFIASNVANFFDGGMSTAASHNRVSYVNDTSAGITVNLFTPGATGVGGLAAGDTYTNIQDITGGSGNDTFIASAAANNFDGSGGTHNRVNYVNDTVGVTVDLVGGIGSGGLAAGDTYNNIQDVTGGTGNDTFIASNVANAFEGTNSGAGAHNRVSYINDTTGVTIDLNNTTGAGTSGGYAAGDTFSNIQDVTGGSGNDTFIASNVANNFDGSGGTHNRVSYINDTVGVTIDLNNTTGAGTSGGYAAGDTFVNIQDLTGGSGNDTFIASNVANNFDGSGGTHNRVSYVNDTAGVTIDLSNTTGAGTSGGYAAGDTLANIQDVTGGSGDDTFIANGSINFLDGGVSTATSHNRVSYVNDTSAGVTVNLFTPGAAGIGGLAAGDTYTNIQDVTGGTGNDTFIASAASNFFDGSGGAHNRVSYANDNVGVTVDLVAGTGTGGLAAGDTYTNIQDVTGGTANDTFIASNVANNFDGGGTSLHNRVSYVNDTTGVTIDLSNTTGAGTSGGFAAGDTFTNIQDVTGGSGNDTFIASTAANFFDGGVSTATSHNRVSYINDTSAGITVDLFTAGATGVSGLAAGDTYANIQDVTGGSGNDTFIASGAANNFDGSGGTHNRVSYTNDTAGVTVDLLTVGAAGVGGLAAGDTYTNIQDVTGGSGNDTFVANNVANAFDGGTGSNSVSYASDTADLTINLFTAGALGVGGMAAGDTYTNIQNLTGGSGNDTFIANSSANAFDGGTSTATSHNRVSYANDTVGVTVDLVAGTGSGVGSLAAGDTYTNIQDVTGGTANDTFIASNVANNFDGGGTSLHNRVSYVNDTTGVTIDLSNTTGAGTSGGFAAGDTFTNIQDVTGGSGNDIFIASTAANFFDGGVSTATSHNRVSYANDTSAGVTVNLFTAGATGTGGLALGDTYTNIQDVTGGTGNDTFIASAAANFFDGGTSTATSHNRVSYANDTVGVTVDLVAGTGSGVGSLAAGDTYTNIQDVTGGTANDTFIASNVANNFDGGGTSLHNRVSYVNDTTGVTIDLSNTTGAGTSGGFAAGDTFTNIQDVTGGSGNDIFIASTAANFFDGGVSTATSHNRVSYANDTSAGVTVNLFTAGATGTGGLALGDTYTNIQDVTGGTGNDTFIASAAANFFDGGTSTATSHNRVSYANDTVGVTVDLVAGTGSGVGSLAAGDTYTNIQDVTGGTANDTFIASNVANNFDGGGTSLHNRVSYVNDTTGVTIDLSNTTGAGTSGGFAAGDTFTNIQDVTGGSGNDIFIASTAANFFDGGVSTATSHNRVSYANDTSAGVTVNLFTAGATGTGGLALGDTYTNIQDVTGGTGNDTFIASAAANFFDGGTSTATSHNRVSYSNDTAGVIVDLFTAGSLGLSGLAAGDTYTNIQDLTGGTGNDTFIASGAANFFDGGTSTATSHNRVSYANDTAGVTVNLFTAGTLGVGGLAAGDTYTNIQDLTGGTGNDTFIASAAANFLDGGAGTHNLVSYANDTAGVTVNLITGTGTGGLATGDTYVNIQDINGGTGNDTLTGLAAGGSTLIGGAGADTLTGAAGSLNNTISYVGSAAVQVDLYTGAGTIANTGGDAAGDILSNIQNVIGSANNDIFYASLDANIFTGNGSAAVASPLPSTVTGRGGDTVSYLHSTSAVTVNLSTNTASGGFAVGDSFVGITNLVGSAFNDTLTGLAAGGSTLTGGAGADTLIGLGTNNTITYVGSTAAVNVDLYTGAGTIANTGGDAAGDILNNIQNIIGSTNNDLFYASADANIFVGGGGVDTVSYLHAAAGVTVDLNAGSGSGSAFATGDTYFNIQNATGSAFNDTFVASNLANVFNGGTAGSDTVSYSASTAAVTVDLFHGTGANGYAAGDSYINIQNAIGSNLNDTFVGNSANNIFNGGTGTDTVSYQYSTTTPIVASLATNTGTSGDANGDSYVSIENLTGSENVNSTLTGNATANVLTALGLNTTNVLVGGGGNDTFDGIAGLHNTMTGGTGADLFKISATGTTSNVDHITGGGGADTLEVHGSAATLNASAFSGVVSGGINTLDLSKGTYNVVQFSYDDVHGLGGGATLNLQLNNNEGLSISTGTSNHFVFFSGTNDYAFYNASNVEIGRLHLLTTVP